MAKVTGIGGVFFRALDPDAMIQWYHTHLGIDAGHRPWDTQAGPTVFAPFKGDSEFSPASQETILNLRVDDLVALIAQLQAAGIAVETRPEWDGEYGKFARIHDPESRAIELWQPPA